MENKTTEKGHEKIHKEKSRNAFPIHGKYAAISKCSKVMANEAGKMIKMAKRMCIKEMYEDEKRLTWSMNNKTALTKYGYVSAVFCQSLFLFVFDGVIQVR